MRNHHNQGFSGNPKGKTFTSFAKATAHPPIQSVRSLSKAGHFPALLLY
ncbi:hypothetical protein [Spirosoma litoris]